MYHDDEQMKTKNCNCRMGPLNSCEAGIISGGCTLHIQDTHVAFTRSFQRFLEIPGTFFLFGGESERERVCNTKWLKFMYEESSLRMPLMNATMALSHTMLVLTIACLEHLYLRIHRIKSFVTFVQISGGAVASPMLPQL